jgi:tetratricopeptide (TPR) repeat protein
MIAAVFFLPHDINSLLDGISPEERDTELARTLGEIAPRIAADRRDHRYFGPYWWWVKPLLQQVAGTRRSWVRGGYRDRSVLARPGDQPSSPEEVEDARWMAWLGLRYREAELVDDLPAEFHIIETPDGGVHAYDLYDADASRQMDLFAEETTESPELRRLLNDPARFSGSAWLRRADELEAAGETWRAAAALRRAIGRAIDDDDRSRAWLSLGRIFQSRDHIHKAIFCYRNAFERDHEGWVQGLMGDAWLQAGEPHEALRCFRRALESMPGNPEYRAGADRAERAIREESRAAAGYTLLQERLAR